RHAIAIKLIFRDRIHPNIATELTRVVMKHGDGDLETTSVTTRETEATRIVCISSFIGDVVDVVLGETEEIIEVSDACVLETNDDRVLHGIETEMRVTDVSP
ncbi:MAG: hypothetical protein ACRCYM_02380, partial [Cetobacterium sp.]